VVEIDAATRCAGVRLLQLGGEDLKERSGSKGCLLAVKTRSELRSEQVVIVSRQSIKNLDGDAVF
jgi:hypothetical protein